jgi:predicted enzyme related to lactoylglutathione lyase
MFTKSADMPMPPNWLLYANVPGTADAAADRAKAAGAQIFLGPMDVPGGDRIAAMMDPQGAAFAVHSKAPVATAPSMSTERPEQAAR